MRFGKVDHIMLLGGGELLAKSAVNLIEKNVRFTVITSERHSKEDIKTGSEAINLKQFLEVRDIDCHISRDVNNDNFVINKISDTTLGISIGSAWIFRESFINRFNGKLVNVHGTRLPQNRGGGGFSWQILRGNRLGFSVIHQIETGIDTGPLLKYKEFFYPPSCRIPRDYKNLYVNNAYAVLNDFLEDIKNEREFKTIGQQEYFSIYWPRLSTEVHGFIDWNWSLRDIELFICAFDDPYRGASTFINNKRVFLKNCFSDFNDGGFHPFQKGIVYRKTNDALYITAEDGSLIVRDIKDEQGKDALGEINLGDRFYTPAKYLEKAKLYRATYTSKGLKVRPDKFVSPINQLIGKIGK